MEKVKADFISIFLHYFHCRLLLHGDDSVNGSKTQSTVTTESNTPDNTLRLDSLAQKVGVNYTIEDGEVIIESKLTSIIIDE